MQKSKKITFSNNQRDFSATLNRRINDYFKTNQIDRHANAEMVIKTVFMFVLYLVPYGLIVGGEITNIYWMLPLVVVMSFGIAGIGLSVMHDANHGAYSNKSWVNDLIGYSLNLVGANAFNWKIQHNIMHHTFTNIHDEDEDISPRGVLRLSPYSDWKSMHRYQYLYAWPLYGLMTIVWVLIKDFVRIVRYQKNGMAEKQHASITKEWLILIFTKLFYITYIFLIPLLLTSLLWWQIILGILLMHYIAGFILTIIFQPAHVIEGTEYPVPDEDNMLENNWAVHQLHTTTNFGNKSRWFSWYVGGLNFQIEHHLFPNICHVHYRKISKIVRSTAKEYGLPYKTAKTFVAALYGHLQLLKQQTANSNKKNRITTLKHLNPTK
jgi:linoleoyl-CoA desaturase